VLSAGGAYALYAFPGAAWLVALSSAAAYVTGTGLTWARGRWGAAIGYAWATALASGVPLLSSVLVAYYGFCTTETVVRRSYWVVLFGTYVVSTCAFGAFVMSSLRLAALGATVAAAVSLAYIAVRTGGWHAFSTCDQ
jgi:hypothetical protein